MTTNDKTALAQTANLDDYCKAGGEPHSSANQRILDRLVDREVLHLCSSMVSHFAQNPDACCGDIDYDEVLSLCTHQNWRDAWDESDYSLFETSDGDFYILDTDAHPLTHDTIDVPSPEETDDDYDADEARDAAWDEYLSDNGTSYSGDDDDYQAMCNEAGVDPYDEEAYEHWAVTSWFRKRLEEHGEIVGELFDFELWGRCATGQAISMDGVIAEIAAEMQILDGQSRSWAEQPA